MKCQGESYRAYLTKLITDSKAEQALRNYMAQYFSAAPVPEQYRWLRRIARYFAALYASAALAIDYGILPWSKDATLADIRKCMQDAVEQLIASFEREPNSSAVNDQDFEFLGIEQFKELVASAKFVPLDREANSRAIPANRFNDADGVIRHDNSGTRRTLLFSKTLKRWFPDANKRNRLTKSLRARRILAKAAVRHLTRETLIAELGGRVPCYAVSRKRLRQYVSPA